MRNVLMAVLSTALVTLSRSQVRAYKVTEWQIPQDVALAIFRMYLVINKVKEGWAYPCL
jgi:hypothetical protein